MKKKKVLIIISLFLLFLFLMTFTSFFGPSLRQTNCMCKAYACRSCSEDHINPTNIGVHIGKNLIFIPTHNKLNCITTQIYDILNVPVLVAFIITLFFVLIKAIIIEELIFAIFKKLKIKKNKIENIEEAKEKDDSE